MPPFPLPWKLFSVTVACRESTIAMPLTEFWKKRLRRTARVPAPLRLARMPLPLDAVMRLSAIVTSIDPVTNTPLLGVPAIVKPSTDWSSPASVMPPVNTVAPASLGLRLRAPLPAWAPCSWSPGLPPGTVTGDA